MPQPIRLAVVAPASNADPEKVLRGVERLRALGHTLKLMPHALTQAWPYFAATAEQRLEDLHAAFADPEIDAVICIRGGYGSNYLLEGLDLDLLRRNAKPFIGYSDHTAIGT
ncbi:MAG: muramoyltetrapeptide carboxypeptidase, partial [Acidobacteriaceae bacterium]|nr:muramoyltetrapeptide carboxypeptidase [Acidobacteriaceae bacterium]